MRQDRDYYSRHSNKLRSGNWWGARWRPDLGNSGRSEETTYKTQVRWVPNLLDAETAAQRATGEITWDQMPKRFELKPEIRVETRDPYGKLIQRTALSANEPKRGLEGNIQQLMSRTDLTASQVAAIVNQLAKPNLQISEKEVIQ